LIAREQKNQLISSAGFKPGEGNSRESIFQYLTIMANLDDHYPLISQMTGCLIDYPSNHIQPVCASCQSIARFMAIFLGKSRHRCGADVGWIADDQVVTASHQPGK
jgi:hypothetical protein